MKSKMLAMMGGVASHMFPTAFRKRGRVSPRGRFYGQSPEAKDAAISKANAKRERRNKLRGFNVWKAQTLRNPLQYTMNNGVN